MRLNKEVGKEDTRFTHGYESVCSRKMALAMPRDELQMHYHIGEPFRHGYANIERLTRVHSFGKGNDVKWLLPERKKIQTGIDKTQIIYRIVSNSYSFYIPIWQVYLVKQLSF